MGTTHLHEHCLLLLLYLLFLLKFLFRSWTVSNPEEDVIERKSSPETVAKSVVKTRGSTIRREDQQLYDNAVGRPYDTLLLIIIHTTCHAHAMYTLCDSLFYIHCTVMQMLLSLALPTDSVWEGCCSHYPLPHPRTTCGRDAVVSLLVSYRF